MDFSFETFGQLTQSATATSGAIEGVLKVARSVTELVKSPKGASEAEIESAVEKLALAVENAKIQNDLLQAKVVLVNLEVRRAQETQAKLDTYDLYRTPAGGYVYRPKDADSSPQGSHFICPDCHADGRRSILQGEFDGKCGRCEHSFALKAKPRTSYSPRAVF